MIGLRFRDAISSPNMKIIATQTADFSRAAAQRVMENIIQAKGSTSPQCMLTTTKWHCAIRLSSPQVKPGKMMVGSIDGQKTAPRRLSAASLV